MKYKLLSFVILGSAFMLSADAALAQPQPPPPYQAVRTLQKLQDAIANGNMNARAVQEKLVTQTAKQLQDTPAAVWAEPRNFRAAVIFILSGGPPDSVEAALKAPDLSEENKKLLEGAIAFANGKKGRAAELLGDLDPVSLPASLAGHIALVQSMLTGAEDKSKALHSLELARWLMPGTLIEESALRRAIGIAAEIPDAALTDKLAAIYLRRFAHSIYATYFASQFSDILVRAEDKEAAERLARLSGSLEKLPPSFQIAFYLSVAQTAAGQGKTALAAASAASASRLVPEGSPEKLRTELYQATTMIVSGQFDEAVKRLTALDAGKFNPDDAALRQSALALAKAIRAWPEPARVLPEEERKPSEEEAREAKAIADLVARARKELTAADQAQKQDVQ